MGNLRDIKDKAAIHAIARCTLGMGLVLDMKLGWMDSACGVISCQKATDTTLSKNPDDRLCMACLMSEGVRLVLDMKLSVSPF